MRMHWLSSVAAAAAMAVAAGIAGCDMAGQSLAPNYDGEGTALLKIMAGPNSPFARIADHATLTISASDMITMSRSLTVTDSSVEGTITGIPAGPSRLFSVVVYDSANTAQYRGNATANVIADSTVRVSISVVRVSGGAVINGNIVEGDTLPTTGLVAYYPFNGNANDESGNGRNGTVVGATPAADRFGASASAYVFDGVDDYITIGNWTNVNDISVSLWFNADSVSGRGVYLFGANNVGNRVFNIDLSADRKPYYLLSRTTANSKAGYLDKVTPFGKWHHYVLTRTGQEIRLYADGDTTGGIVVSLDEGTLSAIDVGVPYCIGTTNSNGTPAPTTGIIGRMDDVRVYDRALTAQEIEQLYHEGGWTGNAVSTTPIVFQSDRAGAGTQQIYMIHSDGTGLKALTTGGETYKYWPRWSPDGKLIAYNACNTYNGNYVIKVIDSAGTLVKTISTASNIGVHGLCWSADGQWLYYAQNIVCGEKIRKVNYTNNSIDSLVYPSASSVMPQDMDPTGSGRLVFHRYQCDDRTYFSILNTLTTVVSTGVAYNSSYSSAYPKWAPDGMRIVYSRASNTAPYPSELHIVNADGTADLVVGSGMNLAMPDFALNGTKVVASRTKNDTPSDPVWNLWIMDLNGGNAMQLTTGDHADQYCDALQ